MAKDPFSEALKRSREAHELRVRTQHEQKEGDKALEDLKKHADKEKHKANTEAAERAVEKGPLPKKKTPMEQLEEKGRKSRGFKRRGKEQDFER